MDTESMEGFQMTISGMAGAGFGVGITDALLNARSVKAVPRRPKTTTDQEKPANRNTKEDLVSYENN